MISSAITAFILLLSAPAPAADEERSAANAGKRAPAAAEAKASTVSAASPSAPGIDCQEVYRPGGTGLLVAGANSRGPSLLRAFLAPAALLLPELGGVNGEVPDAFDASRCSLGIKGRGAAECLN